MSAAEDYYDDEDQDESPPPAKRKKLKLIHDDFTYFDHQLEGIRQMMKMSGCLLADEPGLGKTNQALTVAAVAYEAGETSKFLVIAPASLKGNWADEMDTFTDFTYAVLPNKLSPAKRSNFIEDFRTSDTHILVVNYEQVVAHLDDLNAVGFGLAIADEAHAIKGKKSKRTKAVHKLKIPRRFPLTGTPLMNQVDDLWAILHWVDPKEWPSYWTFINRYAVFGGWMDKQIVGIKNEKELRERLQRYMIRRTKADCLDLPAKQRIPVMLDMHDEQRKVYDQAKDELAIDAPDPDASPFEIANQMVKALRLKQIMGTTACIPGLPDVSIKLDRAVELIKEIISNGEPVVVFTQFREVKRCLNERLTAAGIDWYTLDGDVPVDERKPVVKRWTEAANDRRPGAITCMYQVAGVGLTMTAASRVILLDKDYSPKINEQAVDRLHRIGQKGTVQIYDLMCRKSYDSKIEKLLKGKDVVFTAAIEVDNSDWKKKLIELAKEEDED